MPSWSDAPFDICLAVQIMKLLFVLFYPSCFNFVPFSARYLLQHLNLEHPWPVTKFHTDMTTDKIVILYVTFCNWSVRQCSCQYMIKFVNLLCQCVTVSLSVPVYKLQSVIYIYMLWLLLQVLKQIDACGHTVQVKCCEKPDPKMCKSPCNRLLHCGHKCTAVCSAMCTLQCQELVPSAVRPACGHMFDVPCYTQNQSECYRFICAGCSHVLFSLPFIFSEVTLWSLFAVHSVII